MVEKSHYVLDRREFDKLLRGSSLHFSSPSTSISLGHSVLSQPGMAPLEDEIDQTIAEAAKEDLGLTTDEDLGEIAVMCLQELTDRGYSVSALYATPIQQAPYPGAPEPKFVVSITRKFEAGGDDD